MDRLIVGGESGNGARPMNPEWVRDIKDQCAVARIAFFFKQWGGVNKKAAGNFLVGKQWLEFPEMREGSRNSSVSPCGKAMIKVYEDDLELRRFCLIGGRNMRGREKKRP